MMLNLLLVQRFFSIHTHYSFFPRQSFIELNFVDQGEAQLAEEQKVTFDFKMLHFVIASIEWMMCVKSIQNFMHIFILMHN